MKDKKRLSMPTGITIETEDTRMFRAFQNPTKWRDITVELKEKDGALAVWMTADTARIRRITLHWAEALPEDGQVLGGAWERGYGDLEWRHYVPERILPWYFLVQSGEATQAFGVRVRPGAMCFWTAESAGYSLYMDTRCGGMGVRLNGRMLCAAEICTAVYDDADGFDAQCAFYEALCSDPILPPSPVYGENNWYHAYGHATQEDVLREVQALSELTVGLKNRPWFIIDDCWQILRADDLTAVRGARETAAFRICGRWRKKSARSMFGRAFGYACCKTAIRRFRTHGARSAIRIFSIRPFPPYLTILQRTSEPFPAGATSSSSTISRPSIFWAAGAFR